MDLRSGRRLASRPQRSYGGADRISDLPDEMILLVLARLRCVRTAVQTGLLSRRWHGLWTGLTDLAFRGVAPATIETALPRFNTAGTAYQLDIHLPSRPETADADSLLRAATLFSPAGLVFTIAPYLPDYRHDYFNAIQLPCFQHATSIELDTQMLNVRLPEAGEFPALQTLSVCGGIYYINTLVTRCPRLRVVRAKFRFLDGTLIGQVLPSLKRALGTSTVAVSLIDISICTYRSDVVLLRNAAALSPQELVYRNRPHEAGPSSLLELPFFHHTTSIEISQRGPPLKLPSYSDKFFALERLCLVGCNIDNLGKSVSCCPRLRVLRVDGATFEKDITVHSTSLEELALRTYKDCCRINIVTPELKKLKMEVHTGMNFITSFSMPIVEKVSWPCLYTKPTLVFGFWLPQSLSLETPENRRERALETLSMHICASDPSDVNLNFAQEIEKLPVTDFSAVDLRLEAMGHVYGATLLHLLEALSVHGAIKILKVTLPRSQKTEVTKACIENCSCDEPKNWRSQSNPLPYLEEVAIVGFTADNHGFDFLKVMLRCAPIFTIKSTVVVNAWCHTWD